MISGQDHDHPLIRFCQRYALLFHADPLAVAQAAEDDLDLLELFYLSAAADIEPE